MTKVEIVESSKEEVLKKFKGESVAIFELMKSLGEDPHKGKTVGRIGGIVIKELNYSSFRFYFIVDEHKLKVFSKEELTDLLIRFMRMSSKNNQQKIIDEIKFILRHLNKENFN